MTELEVLVAEQIADDHDVIVPEFPWQVPFTNDLNNCVGVDMDGEIETFWPRPSKGVILCGTAAWHGSDSGYTNYRCRCVSCREAHAIAMRRYRASKKAA